MAALTTKRRRRLIEATWVAGIVALAVILGWLMYSVRVQQDRVDVLAAALEDEQLAAEDRGEKPVAPSPSDLIDEPTYDGPDGEDQAEGKPPSDAQVLAAIEAYFADHPVKDGEDPSPAEIAAAVANYLIEHPPERGETGPPPSAEQVAEAVATYLTANPPPQGDKGEPGRPPSAEEIAAAVEAYLTDHPIPMCPADTTAEVRTVLTTDGPVDAVICVKT